MEIINIKCGPLTSFYSLTYHMGPKLKEVRELYFKGSTPAVRIDMSYLEAGRINVATLTAFLSVCKKLRDFLGYPIPTTLRWDPHLQGFLADLDFFKIVERFQLFKWEPDGIIGGYRMGATNPNSKLLYYADIKPIKNFEPDAIGLEKALLKQKIAPNFLMRLSNIFSGFDDRTSEIINNTALELIVNSLMHAEDIAYVGVQRTSKRITISVSDSGIGIAKSLSRSYSTIPYFKELTHLEAIVFASLVQRNIHGLRLAIGEVLGFSSYDETPKEEVGWVVISSFDTEIIWRAENWRRAMTAFDRAMERGEKPNIQKIMGDPVEEFVDRSLSTGGIWRKYNNLLVGTRITFEIYL